MRFRNPLFAALSFVLAGLLLSIFKETSWAIFVERFLEEVAHSLHIERAAMIATLSQILLGGGLLWAALYAAFRVGKTERPTQPDPAIEAAKAHTEAIRAHTEVLRANAGVSHPPASDAFSLSSTVYCECYELLYADGANNPTGFYKNVYYIVIGNGLADGRALKRVRVTLAMVGEPVTAKLKDFEGGAADIRHGEWVFVQLGSIVSDRMIGTYKGRIIADESALKNYRHNIPMGFVSFEVESAQGKREFGMSGYRQDGLWTLLVTASADDVVSMQLRAFIDMADIKKPTVSVSFVH